MSVTPFGKLSEEEAKEILYQYYVKGEKVEMWFGADWCDNRTPTWHPNSAYRIKEEPPTQVFVHMFDEHGVNVFTYVAEVEEVDGSIDRAIVTVENTSDFDWKVYRILVMSDNYEKFIRVTEYDFMHIEPRDLVNIDLALGTARFAL